MLTDDILAPLPTAFCHRLRSGGSRRISAIPNMFATTGPETSHVRNESARVCVNRSESGAGYSISWYQRGSFQGLLVGKLADCRIAFARCLKGVQPPPQSPQFGGGGGGGETRTCTRTKSLQNVPSHQLKWKCKKALSKGKLSFYRRPCTSKLAGGKVCFEVNRVLNTTQPLGRRAQCLWRASTALRCVASR